MGVVNDQHDSDPNFDKDCMIYSMVKDTVDPKPTNPGLIDPYQHSPFSGLLPYRRMAKTRSQQDYYSESKLIASSCFAERAVLCEMRVQTVTYETWFVANWVDIMLGFLIVILFVSLCVSICACTASSSRRRRQPVVVTPASQARVEVIDLPPSYDSTVRIHKPTPPPQETTTTTTTTTTSSVWTNMGNKSKQMWSKIYVYRPGGNRNSNVDRA